MKIQSVADLRRCPIGTRFRLSDVGPDLVIHGNTGTSKIPMRKNQLRVLAQVRSKDLLFTGDGIPEGKFSYLRLPKASEFTFDDAVFTIRHTDQHSIRYDYVEEGVA